MIKIRKATIKDSKGIAKVRVNTWKTAYKGIISSNFLCKQSIDKSQRSNKKMLADKNIIAYVALDDNEIIGFAFGGECRDKSLSSVQGEIYAIYILESYSNQGIGRKLLEHLFYKFREKQYKAISVDFLSGNLAEKFYFKLGARYEKSKIYTIGGSDYLAHTYIWQDINDLI